ncbi:MAG: TRZ/ATZ family hydrolase [Pseudomonadota bacterium]
MSEPADFVIDARWVIPVEPAGSVLEHHSVAVRNGEIAAILPAVEARQRFRAGEIVSLENHALLPGFVNAHTHAAMTLFRGLADDLPLMDWLQHHIWPAEAKWVGEEFVRAGTELAMAEMIKGGTTCFNDMYFFADVTARAAETAGLRAVVGLIVLDFPSAWAQNADEYLHKCLRLHDELRHSPHVHTAFAPHAPYTVSDGPLEKIVTYAEELGLPVHMHVHETAHEVSESETHHGVRPLERLARLGLLGPRFMAVHMTQLLPAEIAAAARQNLSVVHCPASNLKLASGFCPVQKLMEAGINVALGTDGAASNNNLDMLKELQLAALLAKGVAGSATALPAHQALAMATLNGARALGLDDRIGSLKPGKAADLIAIDLSAVATEPVYDPTSQIVYACSRDQVTDVWVAGQRLLKSRELVTLDESAIRAQAHGWRDKIFTANQRS